MWDFLIEKEAPYNLRTTNLLKLSPTRTIAHGMNSLAFRGSIIWNTLPDNLKNAISWNAFKTDIKTRVGSNATVKFVPKMDQY